MLLKVRVQLGARREQVKRLKDNEYQLAVTVSARKGAANQAVIRLLAKYLGVASWRLRLLHGWKGREKIILLEEDR